MKKTFDYLLVGIAVILAVLAVFAWGYGIYVVNTVSAFTGWQLICIIWSFIASLFAMVGLIGALILYLPDAYGRVKNDFDYWRSERKNQKSVTAENKKKNKSDPTTF